MEPAAISFKENVRERARTHSYYPHTHVIHTLARARTYSNYTHTLTVYTTVRGKAGGGKNRKPLYKLILGARRINTLRQSLSIPFMYTSARASTAHIRTRSLCLSLSFWIDCLGGKAIFINANEQYEWVFRPAKAFTTNEIFRRRTKGRARGWRQRRITYQQSRAIRLF